MNIEDLKKDLEKRDILYKGLCHDCATPVTVTAKLAEDGTITIEGGAVYRIEQGVEKLLFFKCDECYQQDHTLRNWRSCEVYSRVVGYLRPVQQWNKGKQAEFEMRKEFANPQEGIEKAGGEKSKNEIL